MMRARIAIVIVGLVLPFVARLPGGTDWLADYAMGGVSGVLFVSAWNVIVWGSLIALSHLYRYPSALWPPSLLGFGYVAWSHYALDLGADAQAGVAVVFIPIYALAFIAVGGVLGHLLDRRWNRQGGTNEN